MRDYTAADAVEVAVCGGLMQWPERAGEVSALVSPDDFRLPEWGRLYGLILARLARREPCDLLVLPEVVGRSGLSGSALPSVGDVMSAVEECPSSPVVKVYAREVRERAVRRRLQHAAHDLGEAAKRGEDVGRIVAELQGQLAQLHTSSRSVTVGQAYGELLDQLDREHQGEETAAWSTGLPALDRQLGGGVRPGELVILAARPAMGKTALACNIVAQAVDPATGAGIGGGIISLEMPRMQLMRRLASTLALVSLDKLIDGRRMSQADWGAVTDVREYVEGLPLEIDDSTGLSLAQVQAIVRAWAARGVKVVVLDYLGKMATGNGQRTEEVGRNICGCKDLAKELGIAMIVLHQLNRDCEKRNDKRPMLSDLRDSGEIEQEADVVAFAYRDAYYHEGADPGDMEVIIAKARMGRPGTVHLRWDGAMQLVSDVGGVHVAAK